MPYPCLKDEEGWLDVEWTNDERIDDTTFKAWVATEFDPARRIDGYSVRLARWVAKAAALAALAKGQAPSERDFDCYYWTFDGEWRRYTEGNAAPIYVPRGAFLDPTLDLLKDIADSAALRVLAKTIEEARQAGQGQQR